MDAKFVLVVKKSTVPTFETASVSSVLKSTEKWSAGKKTLIVFLAIIVGLPIIFLGSCAISWGGLAIGASVLFYLGFIVGIAACVWGLVKLIKVLRNH